MKRSKKTINTPATSTKGYWFGYAGEKRRDPSPTVRMMDKHNQIVMFGMGNHHVGVSVTKVSMRDGIMKGTFKGTKVQHQSGGVWVAA